MPFETINDDLTVQVNDQRGNYMLREKVVVTASEPIGNGGAGAVDLVVQNAVAPVVALSSAVEATVCLRSISGTTWTYRIFCSSKTTAITCYVFDIFGTSNSTFGLQVFDGASRLVFDALQKPLRVADFRSNTTGGSTWTYASGRSYAFLPARGGGRVDVVVTGTTNRVYAFWFANACRNNSPHIIERSEVLYGYQEYDLGNVPNIQTYDINSDWMIVDVTNY